MCNDWTAVVELQMPNISLCFLMTQSSHEFEVLPMVHVDRFIAVGRLWMKILSGGFLGEVKVYYL
jgi:hypothetical protein